MNRILLVALLMVSLSVFSCKSTENAETTTKESAVKANSVQKKSVDVNSLTTGKAEEMQWFSLNEVEEKVSEEPKKILVDVYTKWCGPCKMMDRNTFTNKDVQAMVNEKFYPVKFDAEGANEINFMGKTYGNPNHDPNRRGRNSQHELSRFFAVRGYPTLVVMDENFNILQKIVGYKTPEQLLKELQTI